LLDWFWGGTWGEIWKWMTSWGVQCLLVARI
jgi:hypothetical protein